MMNEKKHRAVLKNFDNAIDERNEPYSSIIKILFLAQYNKTFELMKVMELKELIVKRYTISSKKRDKERYDSLQDFKKELMKYADISLDQEIKPINNLYSSSSDHHRFESYLGRLEDKGFIERPKWGYCRLSLKFSFKPFKDWLTNIIDNCPIEQSATYNNSILLLPNISINEFDDDEILELRDLLLKSVESYREITKFLVRISFKRANKIWENFITRIEASNVTKFYYWLKLVEYHYDTDILKILYYSRTLSNDKGEITDKDFRNLFLYRDTLDKLRRGSYKDWEEYFKKYNFYEWIEKFERIFYKAFVKYIKNRFPSKNIKKMEERFFKERKRYDDDFYKTKSKTLIITAEIEYCILLFFPDFLTQPSLEKLGVTQSKVFDIENAIKYVYNRHPFIEKFYKSQFNFVKNEAPKYKSLRKLIDIKNPQTALKEFNKIIKKELKNEDIEKEKNNPSFFENVDFFKDFGEQLKNLGIKDKDELYKDLRFRANMFKMPSLIN